MAYTLDEIREAQTLYVSRSLTYDEVADETGISVSQLKAWGQEHGWREQREQHMRQELRTDANIGRTLAVLAEKNADAPDSQDVFAIGRLLDARHRQPKTDSTIIRSLLLAELNFFAEHYPEKYAELGGAVVAFLDHADPDLLRLKSWQKKTLKEKVAASVGSVSALVARKNLDPDTLRKIREEVYGIVDTSA